jgi:uncharacterized membrane protein YozB (DUF420 family)
MDPKLLFWCLALANLALIVAFALTGVQAVRRGDVRTHRRNMLTAASLVALFLVSYLVKVAVLGREDRSLWTPLDRGVLYVHETFVVLMLGGGGFAALRAWRFRARLGPALALPRDGALPGAQTHRRAGWVAVVGAALAFVTAGGVLAGMFARASG